MACYEVTTSKPVEKAKEPELKVTASILQSKDFSSSKEAANNKNFDVETIPFPE